VFHLLLESVLLEFDHYMVLHIFSTSQPGSEADHSPSTSAEVQKMCIYTPKPQFVFMV
jgi:hypothetical protein